MIDLNDLLAKAAELHADKPAIISDSQTLNYADFWRRISDASETIQRSLSESAGPVCLLGPNSLEYALILFAVLGSGRVACPVSTRSPKGVLESQAAQIGSSCILLDSSISPEQLPSVVSRFSFDDILKGDNRSTEISLIEKRGVTPPGTIMFTAGSTSEGKAVFHKLDAHYHSAVGSNANIALVPEDRWLLSLPLYHVGGLAILFRSLLAGACVVIADPGRPLAEIIDRERITHLSLVPTQLLQLLDEGRFVRAVPNLKAVLLGGAAADRSLIDRAIASRIPLYYSYGLTEAASQVTTTAPGDTGEYRHSSGRPLKHRRLKISHEGEVLIAGETMCDGYVGPDGITSVLDDDGWFATGDLGRLDEQGCLHVLGRRDSMIVSGGENIYPEELEKALMALHSVQEALVVGVPDKKYGQRPVAFVRLADESGSREPNSLIAELQSVLPGFKIPDRIFPWPDEIDNRSIKPDRRRFSQLARTLLESG